VFVAEAERECKIQAVFQEPNTMIRILLFGDVSMIIYQAGEFRSAGGHYRKGQPLLRFKARD